MMNAHTTVPEHRLRSALLGLAASIDFLNSPEGRRLLAEMHARLIPRMLAEARRMGVSIEWFCADDVLHTAIVRLCENDGRVAKYAAAAHGDPWVYLERCLQGWVRQQWGTRCTPLTESLVTSLPRKEPQHSLTALDTAVKRTCDSILHCVEPSRRPVLHELLTWLAHNPPQRRSYEAADRAAAAWRFPAFTMAEVAAITNIVWGGRPRYRETSLLAAYLLNDQFRPSDSPSHARALLHFKRTMNAARSWQSRDESTTQLLEAA